jgi:hypothetical protein
MKNWGNFRSSDFKAEGCDGKGDRAPLSSPSMGFVRERINFICCCIAVYESGTQFLMRTVYVEGYYVDGKLQNLQGEREREREREEMKF